MSHVGIGPKQQKRPKRGEIRANSSESEEAWWKTALMHRHLRRIAPNGIAQREVDEVIRRMK
jgi:hypothetical protein